jgi:hypothetical protein
MKKFFLAIGLVILVSSYSFAQSINYFGPRIDHRSEVSSVDTWFSTAQNASRSGSVELKGYNSVRIDANVSVNGATIICNLACSNDAIWISGDALTFTKDSYQDVILQGCNDYYVNLDSISSGNVTFYLQPFNQ